MDWDSCWLDIRRLVRISGKGRIDHERVTKGSARWRTESDIRAFNCASKRRKLIMNELRKFMTFGNEVGYTNQPSYNHC